MNTLQDNKYLQHYQSKSNQIMNVEEALSSISGPRDSIPEWEMGFHPGYELNSDFCNVSS